MPRAGPSSLVVVSPRAAASVSRAAERRPGWRARVTWPQLAAWLLSLIAVALAVRTARLAPAYGREEAPAPRPAAAAVPLRSVAPCPGDPAAGSAAIRSLIACEARVWRVPGGPATALSVAACESRFLPAAFNPTGCDGAGCAGLFQQSLRYWAGRAARYGFAGRPPSDPRANVVVSVRMASERGTWAHDWPVCGG